MGLSLVERRWLSPPSTAARLSSVILVTNVSQGCTFQGAESPETWLFAKPSLVSQNKKRSAEATEDLNSTNAILNVPRKPP